MRAIERRGAHADPREMRGQVEPAPVTRHLARLRLFVVQQQRFVRSIEIHPAETADRLAGQRFHEAHRIADRLDHVPVFVLQRRVLDPGQIPIFRMMQIGEAAVDQRTHEVHRQRRFRMRFDQALRICGTRLPRLNSGRIDDIAAIARQGHAVACFGIGRTRLGVLAGETADAHDRQLETVHQHEAHLQQHLQPIGDQRGFAVGETFGAIAALQQEAAPFGGIGQLALERQHFPRSHQRRQFRQVASMRGRSAA